jgi:uncharacterized linocin/CFP29 family protein
MSSTSKNNRGKDQIHWSEGVWKALDIAVLHEMMRTRVAAKFLPTVHVDKKQTTVPSDVVVVPVVAARGDDAALSIDEAATNRIQEYWMQFRMSVAQVEKEEHEEAEISASEERQQQPKLHAVDSGGSDHHQVAHSHHHEASTAVSLAMRTANMLAQAEDLILFNGQNAVANSPLFGRSLIQSLDANLQTNVGSGLLNITAAGDIVLPPPPRPDLLQVIPVHPVAPPPVAGQPPLYRENTLNAVAQAFSVLQGLGHYENYALILNTVPYADLHQALPTTLIEPVEPISHLVRAGIHGTGTLPPFTTIPGAPTGLPVTINGAAINFPPANRVLYTGVLLSLSGNTMDLVRGRMDENLDVSVTFNQKDASEQYRFRVVERFCLRLKDPTAVALLLFMDA